MYAIVIYKVSKRTDPALRSYVTKSNDFFTLLETLAKYSENVLGLF